MCSRIDEALDMSPILQNLECHNTASLQRYSRNYKSIKVSALSSIQRPSFQSRFPYYAIKSCVRYALCRLFVDLLGYYNKTFMGIDTRCGRKIHQILSILSHTWTKNGVCKATFAGKILKSRLKAEMTAVTV